MGPHEPYWRTNSSFSPSPSRWDFRLQSEGLPYSSNDDIQLYESPTSSNSKGSKSWGPQWTPPALQEISVDDYGIPSSGDLVPRQFSRTPTFEGSSANPDSRDSTSSHSDSNESELRVKSCLSSHRNFSSRLSFMSKPIYPLSFPTQTPIKEASDSAATLFSDHDASTPQRDEHCWSSASSSIDLADVSEPFESESYGRSYIPSDVIKCGLCEKFLSQRSPWSSRRIVRSGDMPCVGVLSCRHVFHAECLEQTTPKAHKSDPPCPLCIRILEENLGDQQVISRLKNGFPRFRSHSEDGQSRPWACAQTGDCVEGALLAPSRNTMMLLNRNRVKKNLSMKGNSSKEFPGVLRKSGSYSSPLLSGKSIDQGAGCSKATAGPSAARRC